MINLFELFQKRVIHFTRNDSKGENASKGFVLLPASLSNVLHVAMYSSIQIQISCVACNPPMSGKEFHLIKELTYSRLTATCEFEPPFFAYLLCGSLLKVIQNPQTGEVWIVQEAYAQRVLQKFGMENAKPINTPVDASLKLVKTTEDCESVEQVQFQSAVGSLLYLSIMTRPDITYAVSNVAKFCASPSKQHWTAVKQITRYLKGTLSLGLLYRKDGSSCCIGYCDADWAGWRHR